MCAPVIQNMLVKQIRDYDNTPVLYSLMALP